MSLPTDTLPPAAITADEQVALLERLVRIPSPSGEEGAAAAALVEWMGAHGFDAYIDEVGNAVGSRGGGPREVLLLGHIDTFPGELPVTREAGWLSGRGTVDAKGPLCAFAAAAGSVGVPPGWRVTVVGAVEEEVATSKGARHLLAHHPPPAYCVIGEPSGWNRVTLGYKGRLLAHLRLRAPFAHSAGQAALPAEQAVGLWERVRECCAAFNDGREEAFARLEPSLRAINSRDDGAYGLVEMALSFRLPPGLGPDALAAALSDWLAADGEGAELELAFSGGEPAHQADKNTPLVREFLRAIRGQGARPRFVVKTGTSDMNVVGPAWGCPILAYGPGDAALDHTPEERIEIETYLRAVDVLRAALAHLMREETGRS
jgi:LysW-gamma-L-lysine carboxypeptidase